MKDEVEYFREVGLLQTITVNLAIAALSEDGSHFRMRNEFRRQDGKRAALLHSEGGWLNLDSRKLIAPPQGLLEALRQLPRTRDFAVVNPHVRA
jgi:acyl-CoA thioester hydrolase